MAVTMTWNGTWAWGRTGHAGHTGHYLAAARKQTVSSVVRGAAPQATGVLQGPWVSGGSWGGRPAVRRFSGRQGRVRGAASRPHTGLKIGWRRLGVLAGDVLMVLAWAAMIPGMMWLGAAAGF